MFSPSAVERGTYLLPDSSRDLPLARDTFSLQNEPLFRTREVTMQIPFFFVDVFAEQPMTGNPLSVVPQAEALDDLAMKRIANEFNQAETTFILPASHAPADWRLRSFTAAGHEVFGAGHNSLGAWWWLAESGKLKLSDGRNHFTQEIGESLLPVEVYCERQQLVSVIMTQTPPVFGNVCDDIRALAESLGLEKEDLLPQSYPAQVVSTGAAHLLVPVRDRAAIARARPDTQRLAKILQAVGGEGCYLFCLDTVLPSSVAHARFFNPTVGILEDSATGTAAGPLACHLVRHGIVKDGATMTIEQGYEMKRPSSLRVEVHGEVVRLAGRCITVANGILRIH
jgi:trans-2,3-dihydro-3-hydroxyanthranilate isomerase